MTAFDQLLASLQGKIDGDGLDKLRRAYAFAARAHDGEKRLSGEPYLNHLVEVAQILARLHLDVDSLVTGLLHDTLEDTGTTIEQLHTEFGNDVAEMVDGVSKLGRMTFRTSEQRQAESFRKMLLAMARDIRVILVKLADRLHNMRTLKFQAPDRQLRIAQETLDIYAPLANRLGISWIKSELEDLSFATLEPGIYTEMERQVARHTKERGHYIDEVRQKLQEILTQHGIDGKVQGRIKHLYSIYNKLQKQGIDFDQLHDLIAFRIVVPSVRDCYAMLGIIHSAWRPIPGRFKDYIAMPKANMYQSLHTTVMGPGGQRMEIQIRTEEMHRIAEEGIAAHWKYKEGGGGARSEEHRFGWLRQLMEWQKELKDSREFMSSVKIDLFPEEVYVFTPRGDVHELPRDSSPVDFAYSIHSDLGHRCSGAKVNGKLVPLKTPLKNGDIVEIVTSLNQVPSKDWLKFVKTSKARNRIRHWVKDQERQKSVELGREILEKELRKYGVAYNRALALETMAKVLNELSFKSTDDLLAALGYGKVTTGQVISRLLPDRAKGEPVKTSRIEEVLNKVRRRPSGGIRVQGLDDILVRFAKCCNPLPGDKVVGFISRGHGVTVHNTDCPRVLETDPGRCIEVSWDLSQKAVHSVKVRVYCDDVKGILAAMTAAITKAEANIARASAYGTGDGRAVNTFELNVNDLTHLNQVIDAIRKLKGVQRVERIRQGGGVGD